MKVAATFLSIEKDKIKEQLKVLDKTNIDYIHVDIMDGKFVNNNPFSFAEIKDYTNNLNKPLDIHLMVLNPDPYIDNYATLNPSYITVHQEIDNLIYYINKIKSLNIKVGVSIKLNTNIKKLYPILKDIDLVLIMSIEPGFGGQKFIEKALPKVKHLRKRIIKEKLNTIISIDGGINEDTALKSIRAGVDMLVVGSFITNSNNYQEQINKLK